MNVSQLARYRALIPSLRKPDDRGYMLYWRVKAHIEAELHKAAAALVPVKQGHKSYSDTGESGCNWVLFRNVSPRLVRAWLEVNGWEQADVSGSHDCTGELYRRAPWVRQVGSRVLVTQSWGYDV